MGVGKLGVLSTILVLLSCGEGKVDEDAESRADAYPLRVGQVMVETGHRLETSGRARLAGRWDLAAYEAHEIVELFEGDLTRALLPGACDDEVADAMFFALVDDQLPALRSAADAHDAAAYDAAFSAATGSCNGCHATCEVSFVSVPGTPGVEVPQMSALGAAASEPEPESESESESEPESESESVAGSESGSEAESE